MSALDILLEDLYNQDVKCFEKNEFLTLQGSFTAVENYLKKLNSAIETYEKTGTPPDFNFDVWEECEDLGEDFAQDNDANKRSSLKENIKPSDNLLEESSLKSRPRRNAFKEATQNILSSNVKLKGPNNSVIVKKEKTSTIGLEENLQLEKVTVKTENEEMPAPTRPAPKKRQRKNGSKIQIKQEKITEESTENTQLDSSVVLIESNIIPTIDLLDSDTNEITIKKEEDTEVKNTKRTKQGKKPGKRARTPSNERNAENSDKRSKSDTQPNPAADVTTETNYEDAVSNLEEIKENNNATFIADAPINKNLDPPATIMNETVVVQNPRYAPPLTANDLLTDDESEDEKKKKKAPQTVTKTVSKPSKQVFSPFEPSPVKKKVQAFEKLREEANAIPVRITRTKTKAQAKEAEEDQQKEVETKSIVKEKAKLFTPIASKFIPTAASTTQKINRLVVPSSSNESISSKLASSLKASQYEYKEREMQRKGKEKEALKKREALLQAQIEERRRKREEKQMKAQQQREALEKEKLKTLEIQRLKDERHRQLIAEQEEKKQKQKEELEKKRLMAKMKAMEEKKKEKERRLEEQKKTEELAAKLAKQDEEMMKLVKKQKMQREKQKKVPIYMTTKAPLLPTLDCFDSDDDSHGSTYKAPLTWDRKENLIELEIVMLAAAEAVKNSFFSRQAQTPDLQDIFEVIEPQKLKRSSSALWQKPPRFTMMADVEERDENYEDNTTDDDD